MSGLLVVALVGGLLTTLAPGEAAVAAPPASAPAAVTAPARDLTRVAGVLIRATPTDPVRGETVSLDVSVGAGSARSVTLQREAGTRWVPVTTRRTAGNGSVRFTVTAAASPITYRVVVAPDSRKRLPGVTGRSVTVAPVVAKVTLEAPSAIEFGRVAIATVEVTPKRAGPTVSLQRKSGSVWVTVVRGALLNGRASIALPAGSVGQTVVYRAIVSATTGGPQLTSAAVSVRTVKPRPIVGALAPAAGTLAGGTTVTATGRRFSEVTEVLVGGAPAPFEIVSDTQLTFVTPSGTPGPQDVRVLNDGGEAVSTFSYELDEDLLDEEYVASAGTYVVDPARLVAVDAEPIDPEADDQVTVPRHVVTLTDAGALPAVGDGFFLPPSAEGESGDGVSGTVSALVDAGDGTVAVTVETTQLTEVLDSYNFEASAIADEESLEPVGEEPSAEARTGPIAPISGAREVAAAEEGSTGVPSIDLADLGPSMFECKRTDGSIFTLADGLKASVKLENTRLYTKVAYGLGERYVRTYLYTEIVFRLVGKSHIALDCKLSTAFVNSMRRTLHLSYGFTLSVAPKAEFHVSAAGGYELEQRWVEEFGYEQTNDDAPRLINNTYQRDPVLRLSADIEVSAYAGVDVQLGWMDVVGLVAGFGIEAALEFHAVVIPDPRICVSLSSALTAKVRLFIDLWARWEKPVWDGTFQLADAESCWKPDEVPQPEIPTVDGVTTLPPDLLADRGLSWVALDGTISEDLTLDASVPGYTITSGIYVPEGVTLTIPAGTRVKLGHCYWSIHWPNQSCIQVDGTLIIDGSKTQSSYRPVIFTSISDDVIGGDTDGEVPNPIPAWKGISAGANARVEIDHLYARRTNGFLVASGAGYVSVEASEFHGSGWGVDLQPDTQGVIRTSTFEGFGTPFAVGGGNAASEVLVTDVVVRGGEAVVRYAATVQSTRFENATLYVYSELGVLKDLHFQGSAPPIRATIGGAGANYSNIRVEGTVPAIVVDASTLYPDTYPDADITWSAPLTYALRNTITIADGSTLRWAPGVRIQAPDCRRYPNDPSIPCINVDGSLLATGTPGRPVRLEVTSDGILAPAANSVVSLTDVKISGGYRAIETGGGASFMGLRLNVSSGDWYRAGWASVSLGGTGTTTLNQSTIRAGGVGLTVHGSTPARVSETTITRGILLNYSPLAEFDRVRLDMPGTSAPLWTSADGAGAAFDIEFTAGTPAYAEVRSSHVAHDVTWDTDLEYRVVEQILVAPDASLTLAAGVVVTFWNCRSFYSDPARACISVEGELRAEGTAEHPVLLQNGNPTTAFFPFAGVGSSVIDLEHVRAEYPHRLLDASGSSEVTIRSSEVIGATGTGGAVIALTSNVPATVDDLTISAGGTAILVGTAPASLSGLRISDTGYGVVNHIAGTVLADSFFGPNVMRMVTTIDTMSAPRTWWGDPAGPPSGAIDGPVTDISPWCLDAACATLG